MARQSDPDLILKITFASLVTNWTIKWMIDLHSTPVMLSSMPIYLLQPHSEQNVTHVMAASLLGCCQTRWWL